jgi:hypothetical protein
MSLQDMAGIEVVFGRMAEGALSWTGIWAAAIPSLEPSMM